MFPILRKQTKAALDSICAGLKFFKRFKYPKAQPINPEIASKDSYQSLLLRNDYQAYSAHANNVKHFINYEQSKGNYFTNADQNKIMDLSMNRGHFPLGYNHQSFKTLIKSKKLDNYLNQAPNVYDFNVKHYWECNKEIQSVVPYSDFQVLFTDGKGSLAISAAVQYGRKIKAHYTGIDQSQVKFAIFSGDNNLNAFNPFGVGNIDSVVELKHPQNDDQISQALESFKELVGSNQVGGVIIEPFQTQNGNQLEKSYYQGLRKIAAQNQVLFMVNEIFTGFGVTGKWWAHQSLELQQPPEFIIFGNKAQSSGFFAPSHFLREFDVEFKREQPDMVKITMMSLLINEIKKQKLLEKTTAKGKVFEKILSSPGKFDAIVRGLHIVVNLNGAKAVNVQDQLMKKGFNCGKILFICVYVNRNLWGGVSFTNSISSG